MATALHVAVRTVHLLSMVALVGGTAVTWYAFQTPARPDRAQLRRVECAFWTVLALLLATGVGNLGALGAPGPATRWGGLLTTKLLVVLVVVLGSFLRTGLVLRVPAGADLRRESEFGSTLERSYLVTTWSLLAVVVLAEVLAHG
ncbi:hypothetical protein [Halorarum halobium]|uniref:hypothetical protein n=1 Tax=Halorarum halobium TaxID=3075121 RepID=UPI0028AAE59B|nr:hypothetical protein [Halobaculum sp. XH14]